MSGLLIQVFIGAAVAGFVQGLSGFAFLSSLGLLAASGSRLLGC